MKKQTKGKRTVAKKPHNKATVWLIAALLILAGALIWQTVHTKSLKNRTAVTACNEFALTHPATWNVSVQEYYDEQNNNPVQCLLTNLALNDLPAQGGLFSVKDDVAGSKIRVSVEPWAKNKTLDQYLDSQYPFSYDGPNSDQKTDIAGKETFQFDNNTTGIIAYLDSDAGFHDPFDPMLRPTIYYKVADLIVELNVDATNETQKQKALDIVKTLHTPFE